MVNQELTSQLSFWDSIHDGYYIAVTSGGFDPLHVGHLRSIINMKLAVRDYLVLKKKKIDKIDRPILSVVIVNGPNFLAQKKGYEFMPLVERMEIIKNLQGVDYVVPWDQVGDDSTVINALSIIKPHFFCKGGDRTKESGLAEQAVCDSLECEIIYNVGGGKIQSSSWLVDAADKHKT